MHMHRESYISQQIRQKKERGQQMARARWAGVRARQQAEMQAIQRDPLRAAQLLAPVRTIVQRVVVIGRDQEAREIVRWTTTTARQWAKLKRSVGL